MPGIWDKIGDIPEYKKPTKKKKLPNKKKDCCGVVFNVCVKGLSVNMNDIKNINLLKPIIRYFTLHVKTMTYMKIIHNHKIFIKKNMLLLPRFGAIKYLQDNCKNYQLKNIIPRGDIPHVPYKWTGVFKGNQPLVVKHIMENCYNAENVKNGNAGLILNLEAGQGKTFVATGLIELINQCKVLVITHTRTIMNQWIEILKNAYPKNKIGCYYGKKKEEGDIVVAVINSLMMKELQENGEHVSPFKYFAKFGFVIIDEVHEYSAEKRKQIYSKLQSTYMIGLSATPDEKDYNVDDINTWNVGEILDASLLKGYTVKDIPFTGEVQMIKYTGHPDYTKIIMNEALDVVSFPKVMNQICEDPYRVHIVVKTIYDLRKDGQFVFVFADRRAYLDLIAKSLTKFRIQQHQMTNDKEHKEVIKLMGGSSVEEMKHAKDNCSVILTTYQYMGTGCSIPKMDAIILATPRKKKSKQYINRIFRLGGNYDITRQIIDIVDWNTCAKSQWYMRKKYYKEKKYPITEINIDYTDIQKELNIPDIQKELNIPDEKPVDAITAALNKLEEIIGKTK